MKSCASYLNPRLALTCLWIFIFVVLLKNAVDDVNVGFVLLFLFMIGANALNQIMRPPQLQTLIKQFSLLVLFFNIMVATYIATANSAILQTSALFVILFSAIEMKSYFIVMGD